MDSMSDVNIKSIRSLVKPAELLKQLPATTRQIQAVREARESISAILSSEDQRLLVVVGPCSIHDPVAALEYAALIAEARARFAGKLVIIMRTYFEKPRTVLDWKGFISDPDLDDSFDINKGLRLARKLLGDIAQLGIPTATEFLDPYVAACIADLISWGAIGARTVESPRHREMASGLSMPLGFKNSTDGNIQVAINSMRAAAQPQDFIGPDLSGQYSIVATKGNPWTHLVLRGSNDGPNYDRATIVSSSRMLEKAGLCERVMVDCSHGNSNKKAELQNSVVKHLAARIKADSREIMGVALESNLVAGRQERGKAGLASLTYGQSITDACQSWQETLEALEILASAV